MPHPSRNNGFALVIALSLMALVLLLLVSLGSLVRVELTSSAIQNEQLQARQNALLGLGVALGTLQSNAGPDRRVTARASLAPNLTADPSKKLWTGVWRTDGPGNFDDVAALREWSLSTEGPRWLVSTADGLSPLPDQAPTADAVTLFSYGESDYDLGDETVPSTLTNREVRVEPQALGNAGHFAYWVGDESLKANMSPLLPEDVLTAAATEPEASWRLLTGNEADLTTIEAFKNTDRIKPDAPWRQSLPSLSRVEDWILLDALADVSVPPSGGITAQGYLASLTDDFTLRSSGLLTDVRRGGLRKDLGYYAQTGNGQTGTDPIIDRNDYPDLENTDAGLPRFGLIRSWYEQGQEISGYNTGAVEPQPHSEQQMGVFPILMRAGIHWHGGFEGDRMLLAYYPVAALWNPYNVPIAAHNYRFEIPIPDALGMTIYDTKDSGQADNPFLRTEKGGIVVNPDAPFFNLAGYLKGVHSESKFVFQINSPQIDPGEILYFTAETSAFGGSPYSTDPANPSRMENHAETLTYFFIDTGLTFSETLSGGTNTIGKVVVASNTTGSVFPAARIAPLFKARLSNESGSLLQDIREETPWYGPAPATGTNISGGQGYSASELIDFSQSQFSPLRTKPAPMGMDIRGLYLGDLIGLGGVDPIVKRPFVSHNYLANVADTPPLLAQELAKAGGLAPGIRGKGSIMIEPGNSLWFANNIEPSPYDSSKTVRSALYSENRAVFGFPSELIYTFYDLPRADTGFQSLGQLQHVRFAQKAWQPVQAFGNAEADPQISREDYAGSYVPYNGAGGIDVSNNGFTDISWVLNDSLWDSHFVSTIPASGSIGIDGTSAIDSSTQLPNPRYRFREKADGSWPSASVVRSYEEAAANLEVLGAFNVNSDSVDAWRALLRSTRDLVVNTHTMGSEQDKRRSPFPRSPRPYGEMSGDETIENDLEHPSNFRGFIALSDTEVEALARRVVEQVRERGPFLSMSDFVNRRLVPENNINENQGLTGALQEAINRVSRDQGLINDRLGNAIKLQSSRNVDARLSAAGFVTSGLLPEHVTGAPNGEVGYHAAGLPGYLTQADLLTTLGSYLTARGDTFIIRAYGDATNTSTGEIAAKAWCEATVQRRIEQAPSDLGRRFEIVDFRWLDESEL